MMTRAGRRSRAGAIRILFLGANPDGTTRLSLGREVREISARLRASPNAERFELVQEWAVRVGDLQAALLRHEPDIIHFSGHGTNATTRPSLADHRDIEAADGATASEGALIIEDEAGGTVPIEPSALENLLRIVGGVRCVVLNACYSASQSDALRRQADCVIGMADSILDKAAIAFAWSFYQALGFGKSVQVAFELGKNQIALEGFASGATPLLVARDGIAAAAIQLLPALSDGSAVVRKPSREPDAGIPHAQFSRGSYEKPSTRQGKVDPPMPPKAPRSIQRAVASVLAVATAGATVYGLYQDKRIAVLAFIGMFFAITMLLVMQRAIREVGRPQQKFYDTLVKIVVVFVVLYFMSVSASLLPTILNWLKGGRPSPAGGSSDVDPTAVSWPDTSKFVLRLSGTSEQVMHLADAKVLVELRYEDDNPVPGSLRLKTSAAVDFVFEIPSRWSGHLLSLTITPSDGITFSEFSQRGKFEELTANTSKAAQIDPDIPFADPHAGLEEQVLARYRGVERASAKTSIAGNATEDFGSLEKLLASLPADDLLLQRGGLLRVSIRIPEEQRNVKVDCWLYAAKYEADQDWHLILGSAPGGSHLQYLTAEITGLPSKRAPSYQVLLDARLMLTSVLGGDLPRRERYQMFDPPLHIVVTGSLLYDAGQPPGVLGPADRRPVTAWEIHPVTRISRATQ